MSSLFRHTLENVTSFRARPGKGSSVEGGEKAPDRGQPAPGSCLPLGACVHICAHDSWKVCTRLRAGPQINDVGLWHAKRSLAPLLYRELLVGLVTALLHKNPPHPTFCQLRRMLFSDCDWEQR
ncbi:hypothetical protein VZT92_014729 [Zoarces viviparus]|uniref:Uncharacterized protein n=1 Tax=Zoarces viviparus TaxID=48416 RepID=A0AAW1F066_ZOAVI